MRFRPRMRKATEYDFARECALSNSQLVLKLRFPQINSATVYSYFRNCNCIT